MLKTESGEHKSADRQIMMIDMQEIKVQDLKNLSTAQLKETIIEFVKPWTNKPGKVLRYKGGKNKTIKLIFYALIEYAVERHQQDRTLPKDVQKFLESEFEIQIHYDSLRYKLRAEGKTNQYKSKSRQKTQTEVEKLDKQDRKLGELKADGITLKHICKIAQSSNQIQETIEVFWKNKTGLRNFLTDVSFTMSHIINISNGIAIAAFSNFLAQLKSESTHNHLTILKQKLGFPNSSIVALFENSGSHFFEDLKKLTTDQSVNHFKILFNKLGFKPPNLSAMLYAAAKDLPDLLKKLTTNENMNRFEILFKLGFKPPHISNMLSGRKHLFKQLVAITSEQSIRSFEALLELDFLPPTIASILNKGGVNIK